MKFMVRQVVRPSTGIARNLIKKYWVGLFSRRLYSDVKPSVKQSQLEQTALHDFHVSKGGKMVPFAGWSMPVLYDGHSIVESVLHTRNKASLFDVSHMLQMEVCGKDAGEFLEFISVADLLRLKVGSGCLSMFTTESGGIIDDCIITRTGESSFYIVSNASRADADLDHIREQLLSFKRGSADVSVTPIPDHSLIALQGPLSSSVLQNGVSGSLSSLKFMNSVVTSVFGVPGCRVSRCGYTGEDGFELSVPSSQVVSVTERILSVEGGVVRLAGLGPRDVCRLEAGMCLYGNDISEETTPIEAGLAWCISKRRRAEGGFIGADAILTQLKSKPLKRRIGLVMKEGRAPARSGYSVLDTVKGNPVGTITSGSPSPVLKSNIAMVYVPTKLSKPGTQLQVRIRKSMVEATVTKMPFINLNYFN